MRVRASDGSPLLMGVSDVFLVRLRVEDRSVWRGRVSDSSLVRVRVSDISSSALHAPDWCRPGDAVHGIESS